MNDFYDIEIKDNLTVLKKYKAHFSTIVIPDNINIIDRQAFYKCTFLKSVTIPKNVKIIETEAFTCCYGLKEVILEEGIEEIRMRAFWNCSSIKSISFPKSLKKIGTRAFESCSSLKHIKFHNDGLFIEEYAFNETPYYNKTLNYALKASQIRSHIMHLELPEGFTHIDLYAYSKSDVKTVYLPNSLRTIGACAFKDCHQLTEVSISPNTYCNSQGKHEGGIFSGCENLRKVIFRGRLDNYTWFDSHKPEILRGFHREKTFMGCYKLKEMIAYEIVLDDFPEQWKRYAINGYLYDEERTEHYLPNVIQNYDQELLKNPKMLIQKTKYDCHFAIYQYIIQHHLVNENNINQLLEQAAEQENTQAVASLLEYQNQYLNHNSFENIIYTGLDDL